MASPRSAAAPFLGLLRSRRYARGVIVSRELEVRPRVERPSPCTPSLSRTPIRTSTGGSSRAAAMSGARASRCRYRISGCFSHTGTWRGSSERIRHGLACCTAPTRRNCSEGPFAHHPSKATIAALLRHRYRGHHVSRQNWSGFKNSPLNGR